MPDRPLTILQLTHQGGPAGSTQSILDLSRQLVRRGQRVLVGCRTDALLARLARDAGLEVMPLDFTRLGRLARTLADLVARERVEVVNSHATRDRRALTWMRWRGALPQAFVVTRRTMPLTSPLELVAVGLTADRTIAVSTAVARALRRRLHPGGRLRVVPNGIALERVDAAVPGDDLAAARAALGETDGRPVVVVVARRKDQDVLLGALPSRIGGLSQSLLEGMALGLPVVASDAGGNPDLVTSGETGLLVPAHDPAAWARALDRVLGDAEFSRRIARAGRERVRRELTLARTAERTEAVYREAVASR